MIRSTLAASLCLSVIVACDGRGVVQMKAHQYSAADRAQARQMMGLKGEESKTLVSRLNRERNPKLQPAPKQRPAAPATELPDEADVKPDDKAVSKSFWEKIDKAGTEAATNVANLRGLVAEKLGKFDNDVANRLAGVSIENKSQFGTTMFDLHAIVSLRGRDQSLHLYNQVISPADAKDLVYGTSKVEVKNFNASNVAEKNITTDELLVSSFCLEPDGKTCKHAYLTIQMGFDKELGKWITAVFELDAQLNIVNSNLRAPGQKELSYYEALERISKMTQEDLSGHDKPSAHLEEIKKNLAQPPAEQVLRNGKPSVATKNDLMEISRTKGEPLQFKPAVETKKAIGPVAKTVILPPKPTAPSVPAAKPNAAVKLPDPAPVNSPVNTVGAPTNMKTKNDLMAISKGASEAKKNQDVPAVPFTFQKPEVQKMDLSNSKPASADKAQSKAEEKPARKSLFGYLGDLYKAF